MPVVTTAEYVVMPQVYVTARPTAGRIRTRRPRSGPGGSSPPGHVQRVQIWPDSRHAALRPFLCKQRRGAQSRGDPVLVKVFPIKLKDGLQAKVEAIVQEFAPQGPGTEDGTLSF